jgi:hypothetical protein
VTELSIERRSAALISAERGSRKAFSVAVRIASASVRASISWRSAKSCSAN